MSLLPKREDGGSSGGLVFGLVVILLLAFILYLAVGLNELDVHRRELKLVSDLKASQDSPEEAAIRLQAELEALSKRGFLFGLLHHLSLALFISFVTIVLIEMRTHKQLRKDLYDHLEAVKQNVWEALGKRLLGERIATELESVMKQNVAQEDCSYVITFPPLRDDIPEDRLLVRVENSFKLRNLTGMSGKTHTIGTSITQYEVVGMFPRFITCTVNGEKQDFAKLLDPKDPGLLKIKVPLPEAADGRVPIEIGMELVYKRRDAESFVVSCPVEGLHVQVVNQVPTIIQHCAVEVFHASAVPEHPTDWSWHFSRALLPGQGFSIAWAREPKPQSQTPQEKPAAKPSILPDLNHNNLPKKDATPA